MSKRPAEPQHRFRYQICFIVDFASANGAQLKYVMGRIVSPHGNTDWLISTLDDLLKCPDLARVFPLFLFYHLLAPGDGFAEPSKVTHVFALSEFDSDKALWSDFFHTIRKGFETHYSHENIAIRLRLEELMTGKSTKDNPKPLDSVLLCDFLCLTKQAEIFQHSLVRRGILQQSFNKPRTGETLSANTDAPISAPDIYLCKWTDVLQQIRHRSKLEEPNDATKQLALAELDADELAALSLDRADPGTWLEFASAMAHFAALEQVPVDRATAIAIHGVIERNPPPGPIIARESDATQWLTAFFHAAEIIATLSPTNPDWIVPIEMAKYTPSLMTDNPKAMEGTFSQSTSDTVDSLSVSDAIRGSSQVMAILGDAGAGKSTALYGLYQDALTGAQNSHLAPLPIMFELRGSRFSPAELLHKATHEFDVAFPGWQRIQRPLMIFIDGFDSLGSEAMDFLRDLQKDILAQRNVFRAIVSCRTSDWPCSGSLPIDIDVLKIQPLSLGDKGQVREYIYKRLGLRRIPESISQEPQVQNMAQNPHLLSLICDLIHRSRSVVLPSRRADVFKEWINSTGITGKHDKDAETVLANIAYEMTSRGLLEISRADLPRADIPLSGSVFTEFLEFAKSKRILSSSGAPDTDKHIRFIHQTFQEYFTAVALSQRKNTIAIALSKTHLPHWRQSLALLGGMLGDSAPEYIEAMLGQAQEDFLLIRPAFIAVRAAMEASGRGLDTRDVEAFKSEVFRTKEDIWKTNEFFEWDIGVEYFFGRNVELLTLAWSRDVQQVLTADSFEDEWSMSRSEQEAHAALVADPDITPASLAEVVGDKNCDRDTRIAALYQLNKIASPELLPLIYGMIRPDNREFRRKAYSYSEDHVDILVSDYEDGRYINAKVIRMAQRFARGADAVKALAPYLDSEDWFFGSNNELMFALGLTQSKEAIPLLRSMLLGTDRAKDSGRHYCALGCLAVLAYDFHMFINDVPEHVRSYGEPVQAMLDTCLRIFSAARQKAEREASSSS